MHNPSPTLRQAAILISSLDAQTARALLEQMPAAQAELVGQEITALGLVDPEERESIIRGFFRACGDGEPDTKLSSSRASLQPLAGIELDGALARRLGSAGSGESQWWQAKPFCFLHEADCRKLRPFLEGEHPQTVALVMSHLPAGRAAELLAILPGALQAEVLRRLSDLDEADPEILREVELGLELRMLEQVHTEHRRAAGLAAVTAILDSAQPRQRRDILANLSHRDLSLATRLGGKPFSFEELTSLDDEALMELMAAAGREVAVLALAGATPSLVDRVLGLLSARDARGLRKALVHLGPTSLADIETAQHELAALADRLAIEGRIDPPNSHVASRVGRTSSTPLAIA